MRPCCCLQSQLSSLLLGFTTCLTTSIGRLFSRPELVVDVLGARLAEVTEATPLADLVLGGDTEELVRAVLPVLPCVLPCE